MIGCFNIKTQGSETFVLLTKKDQQKNPNKNNKKQQHHTKSVI